MGECIYKAMEKNRVLTGGMCCNHKSRGLLPGVARLCLLPLLHKDMHGLISA
jgi:hypothetical protein